MPPNESVLYVAVALTRYRLREGAEPAAAAAVAHLMSLDASAVLALAERAERVCKATRITLEAEAAGRALRAAETKQEAE